MDNSAIWYVGGRWVHPHEATLSINDIAVLRGYSVFESLRTYDRRPFHLDEHLKRLYQSAVLIGLEIPWSSRYFAAISWSHPAMAYCTASPAMLCCNSRKAALPSRNARSSWKNCHWRTRPLSPRPLKRLPR